MIIEDKIFLINVIIAFSMWKGLDWTYGLISYQASDAIWTYIIAFYWWVTLISIPTYTIYKIIGL